MRRQTGRIPAGLNGPPRPPGMDATWEIYCALTAGRQWTDWGSPQALSWQEVDAYQRVTGSRIPASELRLIRLLDGEFRRAAADAAKSKSSDDDDDDD